MITARHFKYTAVTVQYFEELNFKLQKFSSMTASPLMQFKCLAIESLITICSLFKFYKWLLCKTLSFCLHALRSKYANNTWKLFQHLFHVTHHLYTEIPGKQCLCRFLSYEH
jgi:hypothetical protein